MLDAPIKTEESYDVSSSPMYIGDQSSRSEKHASNPNHSLRGTQVNEIASTLLQQISRVDEWLQDGHEAVDDDDSRVAIDKAFIDIAIAFSELDASILFTEAEKAARRQQPSRLEPKPKSGHEFTSTDNETLALLRLRIEDWQRENVRKQRKVSRVETTIHDLGLNVNDVRCAQILSEKKETVAALEAAITTGASLCRQTYRELEGMFAVAKEK